MKNLASFIAFIALSLANLCAEENWTYPPAEISILPNGTTPKISVNSFGNAVAVWVQTVGSYDVIQASYYNGSSWSMPPETISNLNAMHDATLPQVSFNTNGQAMAVWLQPDSVSGNEAVFYSYFNGPTVGWSVSAIISDTSVAVNPQDGPQVSLNNTNEAIVVWSEPNSQPTPTQQIRARFSQNGTSWGSFTYIDTDTTYDQQRAQVTLNEKGNALVLYLVGDLVQGPLHVTSSFRDANVSTPEWISSPPTSHASVNLAHSLISLSVNNSDAALAAWTSETVGSVITSLISLEHGQWVIPSITIDILSMNAVSGLTCARSKTGSCFILAEMAAPASSIYGVSSTDNGFFWELDLLSEDNVSASMSDMSSGGLGDAIAVWIQSNGSNHLVQTRLYLEALSSWQPASSISAIGITSDSPQVAVGGMTAFAVWSDSSNTAIKASSLLLAPAPPASISGEVIHNRFATQTDRVKVISWSASPSPEVSGYMISRDGITIALLNDSSSLTYADHNRGKEKNTYSVTTLYKGRQSSALTLTL